MVRALELQLGYFSPDSNPISSARAFQAGPFSRIAPGSAGCRWERGALRSHADINRLEGIGTEQVVLRFATVAPFCFSPLALWQVAAIHVH